MRGPIDYIVVGFRGNRFDGSILRTIGDAIDSGIINLIALSVISKNKEGKTSTLDIANLGDSKLADFRMKYSVDKESVAEDDLDEVAGLLEAETTAGFLVVEQLWAKPLKKAILDANGFLIAEGRIHPQAAKELDRGEVKYGFT
jgi:hypothetical protein